MISWLPWLATAAVATSASGLVDVRGDTECPSPAALSAALVGLVPFASVPAPLDVAELRASAGSVSVRLLSPQGDVIAERVLPAAPSCAERARTAAVVVAAWEARLRAGVLGPLSVPAKPPPATLPAAAPARVAKGAAPDAIARSAPPSPAPLEVEPGAALLASIVSGEIAAGGLAEVAFARRDGRFGVGVGALAVNTHAATLGPGQGAWRRLGGDLDVRARARFGVFALELRAAIALTALSVQGRSLPNPASTTIFDPGVLAGLRVKLRLRAIAPWIEAMVAFWPSAHNLYLAGTNTSTDLPSAEGLFCVGVTFPSGL